VFTARYGLIPYIKQISLISERLKSRDGVVTSVIPGGDKTCRPDIGSRVLYPEERWPGLEMTTHCLVVPRSEMSGALTPSSLCLHDLHKESFTFNFIKSLGLVLSNVTGLPLTVFVGMDMLILKKNLKITMQHACRSCEQIWRTSCLQ
jgi:hypothetical protein